MSIDNKDSYIIYSKYSNNYRILACKGDAEEIGFSSNTRDAEPTSDNLDATFEICVNPSSKKMVRRAMEDMIKEKINQDLLSINKVLSHLGCQHFTIQEIIKSLQPAAFNP